MEGKLLSNFVADFAMCNKMSTGLLKIGSLQQNLQESFTANMQFFSSDNNYNKLKILKTKI